MSNYRKIEIDVGGGYTYAIRDEGSGKSLVSVGIHSNAIKELLSQGQWEQWVTDETNVFSIGTCKLEQFITKYSEE